MKLNGQRMSGSFEDSVLKDRWAKVAPAFQKQKSKNSKVPFWAWVLLAGCGVVAAHHSVTF